MGILTSAFQITIHFNNWYNGEKDVTCVEANLPPILSCIVGRLRLAILSAPQESFEAVALKTALLKSVTPPHSNLYYRDLDFYQNLFGFDFEKEVNKFGKIEVGSRTELLNDDGIHRNQLVMIFPNGNMEIPIAAFVLTRVMPLLAGATAT